jgi:hypothetical protein
MTVVCFTSLTRAYLPRARVLAETLRMAHPGWPLWAVLVDKLPPGYERRDGLDAFDRVIEAEELAIPRFRAWLFRHDVVEACTAVKGAMLLYLQAHGADSVVYLDPDIAVFHPLASLESRLADASVLLTPHQLAANDSLVAIGDNELGSMKHGAYNLGFLAVRNDADGRAFAAWWAARLYEACYDDPANGLFTDQKYCDLVPGLFGRVAIVRDPGWNVASWNLSRRRVAITRGGDITVNGVKLAFYHFTKHGGIGDVMTERYARGCHEPHELWHWYGRRLEAHAEPALTDPPWHYANFSDGTPIPRAARLYHRQRPDLMDAFADPFDVSGDSLREWLRRHAPDVLFIPSEADAR